MDSGCGNRRGQAFANRLRLTDKPAVAKMLIDAISRANASPLHRAR
jgi:hypothetical protein